MARRLKIVLINSEAVPFAKTGGLGDVIPALAKALDAAGHQVTLIIPHYPRSVSQSGAPVAHESGLQFEVGVGSKRPTARVLWSELPGSNVTVLQIDQGVYFDRDGLYQEHGEGYADNSERFIFFSRAAIETCRRLVLRPDILHCNDWQTGLVPALLRTEYRSQPGFETTAAVFTIHNLLFQGSFGSWDMNLTGLDWRYFNWEQMEAYSNLNLLKTGIVFSEKVTTVSPGYAEEIQTPEFGCDLDPVLRSRADDLVGILNGIDDEEWNPETDSDITATYDAKTVREGKAKCKAALQAEMHLPAEPKRPLLAVVSRLTGQKGFDLILSVAEKIIDSGAQLVVLGTGEEQIERDLRRLAEQHPEQVAVRIGYNEALAHRIEAGADIFLMPSAFEPCGLNQMYSMRYGTVPVVRAVGGLKDSVVPLSKKTLSDGAATGFTFSKYSPKALWQTIEKALAVYRQKPNHWRKLVASGMTRDFSWQKSALEYEQVYEAAMEVRASGGRSETADE